MVNLLTAVNRDGETVTINSVGLSDKNEQDALAARLQLDIAEFRDRYDGSFSQWLTENDVVFK